MLAGAGVGWALRAVAPRAAVGRGRPWPLAVLAAGRLRPAEPRRGSTPTLHGVAYQARLTDELGAAVRRAGGEDAPPAPAARPTPGPSRCRRWRGSSASTRTPSSSTPPPPPSSCAPAPPRARPSAPACAALGAGRRTLAATPGGASSGLRGEHDRPAGMTTATAAARLHERARVRLRLTAPTAPRLAAALVLLVVLSLLLRTTALHAPLLDRRGPVGRHRLAPASSTSRGRCARTARRRCTTCCCTSGWRLFGDGEARTHALSRALRAADRARRAVGRAAALRPRGRAGRRGAAAALDPFLTYYAQETRMYALVALLGCSSTARCSRWSSSSAGRRAGGRRSRPRCRAALHAQLGRCSSASARGVALRSCCARARRTGARSCATRLHRPTASPRSLYLPWVPTLALPGAPHRRAVVGPPALADLWATLASVLGGAAPAMAFALVALVGVAAALRVAPGAGRAARSPEAAGDRRAARGVRRRGGRGLAGLAALAGVGDALLRRRSWAAACCWAASGCRARGGWGCSRWRSSSRSGSTRARASSTTRATRTPRRPTSRRLLAPGDLVVAAHPEYGPSDAPLPAAGPALGEHARVRARPGGDGLARRARPPARRQGEGHRGRDGPRAAPGAAPGVRPARSCAPRAGGRRGRSS